MTSRLRLVDQALLRRWLAPGKVSSSSSRRCGVPASDSSAAQAKAWTPNHALRGLLPSVLRPIDFQISASSRTGVISTPFWMRWAVFTRRLEVVLRGGKPDDGEILRERYRGLGCRPLFQRRDPKGEETVSATESGVQVCK